MFITIFIFYQVYLITATNATNSFLTMNNTNVSDCSYLFGVNNGNTLTISTTLKNMDYIQIISNDDFIIDINFYYDNDDYIYYIPRHLSDITITNVSLKNNLIVGIFIQSQNEYIKCFQLNILNITSNTSSWTALFGKIENGYSKLYATYLIEYANYIHSVKTFTNVSSNNISYVTGIEISFYSENCLTLSTTTTPLKSNKRKLLRELNRKLHETKSKELNTYNDTVEYFSSTKINSTITSTTIDSVVTSTLLTTTAPSCKYQFGSNDGNGYGSYVDRINALEVFFDDDYIWNVNIYYKDNFNYTFFTPEDNANISINVVNLVNMSIVGIYIQTAEYYIKCFKLKLYSLESNHMFWTPLYSNIDTNSSNLLLKTYFFDYIRDIYFIKMYLNVDNISYTYLSGIQIKMHSDICFSLLMTTTSIPITATIFTITNSTVRINTVVSDIPIIVYVCSICIPIIFIIIVLILWFYFRK